MFMTAELISLFYFFNLNNMNKGATKRKIVHRELHKEYGERGYK